MRLCLASLTLWVALSGLSGCAGGPKPIPLAEGVEGLHLKTYSETRWKVWMDLDEAKLQPQVSNELCWAACVRAIQLHTAGKSMTQEQLHAKHILALPTNQREAGFQGEIIDAMAGGFRDQFRDRYVIDLINHADLTDREIILSISAGQPVLFAMGSSANSVSGHIGVIYGVQYEEVEVGLGEQIVDGASNLGSDLYTWGSGLFGDDTQRQKGAIAEAGENMNTIADAVDGREYRLLKVYYWDPANDFDGDGKIDGGMRIYEAEGFEQVKDFTLSQVSALALTQEKLNWVNKQPPGAGVYIRHPYDRMDDPVHSSTVDGFDAGVVVALNQRFGVNTDKQREDALKQNKDLKPQP